MSYVTDAAMVQMRQRAVAYPLGSPEREAFTRAVVDRGYAADDARIDAALMKSQRLRGVYSDPAR